MNIAKTILTLLTPLGQPILAILNLLKNKAAAIGSLIFFAWFYRQLPETSSFVIVAYVIMLINLIIVIAPTMRWLVFNEASSYAEGGQLDKDLEGGGLTIKYVHYRFATAVCYICTTICVGALAFV